MNTESLDCRKVPAGQSEKPGDFHFSEDCSTIYVWLPGVSGPDAIQIQRGPAGGPRVWGWNGDEEKPTLTPSLHTPGIWHGYLRNGRLESV
jgi:hypothetical protein